ncbi:hypothetical protein CYL17_10345 [Thermobispora bispora]|nr:hypothetical protein CYL17_10345 [Thermobispora bispora]
MLRRLVSTAVLATLTTGCAGGFMERTITRDEALRRVHELIDDTVAIIDPKPRLDLDPTTLSVHHCLDPSDGGSEDRIYVTRGYYLRGIPKEKIGDVARQIRRRWEERGHFIDSVSKDGTVIAARSRPDDFTLALSWTAGDVLMIEVSSYCIWPNGTPEPSSSSGPGEP